MRNYFAWIYSTNTNDLSSTPSHGIAFLSVWPDTAQDWMRGDMKGVRALFTLKIKFLGYLKNAWRQEWEETASRDYHWPAVWVAEKAECLYFLSDAALDSRPYTSLNRFMHRQSCGRQSSQDRLQLFSLFCLHSCHVSSHAFLSLKWSWSV